MVRSGWVSSVGLSLSLVLLAAPLSAQEEKKGQARRGGGRGGAPEMSESKLTLLRYEQVLAEVKITPEQKKEIEALRSGLRESATGARGGGGSQEDREKAREKRQQATAEAEKKLEGILKPEQNKRLSEISFQQRGAQALKDEKVAKELKLSEEQLTKINEAITWGQEERRKLIPERGQANRGREGEIREKNEKIQKDVDTRVLAALTDAQKEQFEKLKGSPFKLDRTAQGGGSGGQRAKRGQEKGGEKSESGDDKKI